MLTKLLNVSLVIFATVTLATGQTLLVSHQDSPAATQTIDIGQLNGNAYVNNFFGLSLSVPSAWLVSDARQRAEITKQSKEMLKSDDEKKKTQIADSVDRSVIMLSMTKLAPGQPNNASFMLVAERIPSSTFKTGADVIRSLGNLAKGTNFTLEFIDPIHNETIAGHEFGVATTKATSTYGIFRQRMYVTVKQAYSLQFFYTYLNDTDLATFEQIIRSIKME